MAVQAQSPEELGKKQRQAALEAKQREIDTINASRTGVGTRLQTGMTRGKGTMVITWEAFDESKPETVPKKLQEFIDVTKAEEPELLKYLIIGYNEDQYVSASDPLKEFVDAAWPEDAQTQFRLVVRNYARALAPSGMTLEKAVEMIKPGFVAQFGSSDASRQE